MTLSEWLADVSGFVNIFSARLHYWPRNDNRLAILTYFRVSMDPVVDYQDVDYCRMIILDLMLFEVYLVDNASLNLQQNTRYRERILLVIRGR
jgi:hypothetical protein